MSAHNLLMAAAGASVPTPPDPQFNYVTMLLHGDGTNGAQNNTFVDSSSNALSITRNGNTTQGAFSPFTAPEGYWGISSENGGTISHASGVSSTFAGWGGRTRTFELWVYRPSSAEGTLQQAYAAVAANGRWFIYIGSNNKLGIGWTTGTGSQTGVESTMNVPVGQWAHIAVCVDSTTSTNTTIYFCVNGVISTSTGNNFSTQTSTFGWGAMFGSGQYLPAQFQGMASNIRWSSNIRYSGSSYTVPTARFTTDANTFFLFNDTRQIKDSSGNNYNPSYSVVSVPRSPFSFTREAYSPSVNGGSAYFDGSGDYLRLSNVATQTYLGSGDWTLECWVYYAVDQNSIFVSAGQGSAGYNHQFTLQADSSTGIVYFGFNQGNGGPTCSAGDFKARCWNHVAVVRNYSANNIVIYVNGVGTTTTGVSGAGNSGVGYYYDIGEYFMGTYLLNGYISNLRQVTGVAVYSGNFTPPTKPLATSGAASAASYPSTTNVNTTFAASATQLLFNGDNGGIIDNAMMTELETVGNAQISTSVKKYGTGSMAFDGSGDYLWRAWLTGTDTFATGYSDFTVEMWVNFNSLASTQPLVWVDDLFAVYVTSSTQMKVDFRHTSWSATWSTITATVSLATSTWYHVAVVRSGGNTITLYVDGVSKGTITVNDAAWGGSGSLGTRIGAGDIYPFGGPDVFLNGYIDDLRITKGYARYTGNFTPPTAAFSDK